MIVRDLKFATRKKEPSGAIDMPPGLFNPVDGIVDTVVPSKLTFRSVLYGQSSVISAYIG